MNERGTVAGTFERLDEHLKIGGLPFGGAAVGVVGGREMRIDTGDFEPGKGAEGADKVWRVDGKLAEAAHARVNFDMDFESTFRAAERADDRSEERRVGKECRSRWSPYH